MFSTLVCIVLLMVMVYFLIACLYEVGRWISHRITDLRQGRQNNEGQRAFTPA